MSSVCEIVSQLRELTQSLTDNISKLEREREEIVRLMNNAQAEFGNSREGQQVVYALSNALNDLARADASLFLIKNDIYGYEELLVK